MDWCRLNCPLERDACGLGIVGLTGGYYEVIRLDSPLENVISQDQFLSSQRAQAQAIPRAALIQAEYSGELNSATDLKAYGQCLVSHVTKIRSQWQVYLSHWGDIKL